MAAGVEVREDDCPLQFWLCFKRSVGFLVPLNSPPFSFSPRALNIFPDLSLREPGRMAVDGVHASKMMLLSA